MKSETRKQLCKAGAMDDTVMFDEFDVPIAVRQKQYKYGPPKVTSFGATATAKAPKGDEETLNNYQVRHAGPSRDAWLRRRPAIPSPPSSTSTALTRKSSKQG